MAFDNEHEKTLERINNFRSKGLYLTDLELRFCLVGIIAFIILVWVVMQCVKNLV
jgi:hypothetical protein